MTAQKNKATLIGHFFKMPPFLCMTWHNSRAFLFQTHLTTLFSPTVQNKILFKYMFCACAALLHYAFQITLPVATNWRKNDETEVKADQKTNK